MHQNYRPNLVQRQHYEGPSSCHLHSDGHKLGVDGAGSRVVCFLCDEDILVAVLLAGALAVHVPELGGPDPSECALLQGQCCPAWEKTMSVHVVLGWCLNKLLCP